MVRMVRVAVDCAVGLRTGRVVLTPVDNDGVWNRVPSSCARFPGVAQLWSTVIRGLYTIWT